MLWLAFDLGSKRVGVALGSALSGARPLAVLDTNPQDKLLARIAELIKQWGATRLLVGLPLTLDGESQPMTKRAQAFIETLRARTGLPVHAFDERYSSKRADRHFADLRAAGLKKKKDAGLLDAMAAAVILEDFLATQSGGCG